MTGHTLHRLFDSDYPNNPATAPLAEFAADACGFWAQVDAARRRSRDAFEGPAAEAVDCALEVLDVALQNVLENLNCALGGPPWNGGAT